MAGGGAPGRPCPDRSGAEKRARAAPEACSSSPASAAGGGVVSTGTVIEAKGARGAAARVLGPKSRKNCHESHERGKPTAIFSKRRKIGSF